MRILAMIAVTSAAPTAALLIPGGSWTAEAADLVPVPRSTLYPGDTITEPLLTMVEIDARFRASSEIYRDPGAVTGLVARRTLLAGQPIAVAAVRRAYVINAGQAVIMRYEAEGLRITAQAEALQPGAADDVISVRNVDSGVTVKARVAGPRSVVVEPD